jgi:DUF1680 family protein
MKKTRIHVAMIFFFAICNFNDIYSQDNNDNILANSSTTFSFEESAVTFLSPGSVHLNPNGRFYSRYQGNINYLLYQYEYYGEEMLEAFAARNYYPGKLLERMWDGEYAGKWLDAATRTAVNSGDDDLFKMVDDFAASLIKYQQPDGFLGIPLPKDRELNEWEQDWDLWCQWTSMIGLLTHYELRGERASLEAASGVGKWIVKNFGPIEDNNAKFLESEISGGLTRVVITGQLVRLYRHTGNASLIDFVRQVIRYYPPIQQMLSNSEPFLAHPYMLSAVISGVVKYAEVTKDYEMLEKVEKVWDSLTNTHLFPTGSLGESEDLYEGPLQDVPEGQLRETCATTEWIFFTQNLYAITGRAKYAEALELTCYNALLAAQSADGMKWCYWTPLRYSKHWFHGPTRCCFWSGPRGIARLPQLIYANNDNSIYVNFFESSTAIIPASGGDIQIKQDSKYLEIGKSTLTLKTPSGWRGMLRIRVPSWTADFQAKLNGILVSGNSNDDGYFEVGLENLNEYTIEVQFDIPLFLEQLSEDNYVIRRGPEVLAVDMRDNIDTWLGQDDLVSIPEEVVLMSMNPENRYQWAGPVDSKIDRRRYRVKLNDERTSEFRSLILTPYAEAGNEGAAFRTVFPLTSVED